MLSYNNFIQGLIFYVQRETYLVVHSSVTQRKALGGSTECVDAHKFRTAGLLRGYHSVILVDTLSGIQPGLY